MKILQVNKFLYLKGGAETYLFSLADLLHQRGHEIVYFSQDDEKNIADKNSSFFVPKINLSRPKLKDLIMMPRMFWYPLAAKRIIQLIKKEKPDLVHIHNIYHQLSPSILPTIKKLGLPIVMTVHDFKLIDPAYTLRADNKKMKPKNSILAGLIMKAEFNFHKWLKIYKKNIDLFIAPSEFVKQELVKSGFDEKKIVVIPHFISLNKEDVQSLKKKNQILAYGRLDESKAFDELITAFSKIKDKEVRLAIAGQGPEKENLVRLTDKLGLKNRVDFLGQLNKEELKQEILNSLFIISPSRVHETFGLAVLEAMALGKAVIAAKVGAIPEIIKSQKTGLLYHPGNIEELTSNINLLLNDTDLTDRIGNTSKESAEKNFNSEDHYNKILSAYLSVK